MGYPQIRQIKKLTPRRKGAEAQRRKEKAGFFLLFLDALAA
jgi:hypothetical protein